MSVRHSPMYYIRRYGPAEVCGTVGALAAGWLALHVTGSLATAAIAATIGENIGYYGITFARDSIRWWQHHGNHPRLRRLLLTASHTNRSIFIEFGPAEALDSLVVRPGLMYALPTIINGSHILLFLAAKLCADVVFYSLAIMGHRIARRIDERKLMTRTEGLESA